MCVTLYSIERLCVFSMYVLMGFTLVELFVLLKSEGVFGVLLWFCPPLRIGRFFSILYVDYSGKIRGLNRDFSIPRRVCL